MIRFAFWGLFIFFTGLSAIIPALSQSKSTVNEEVRASEREAYKQTSDTVRTDTLTFFDKVLDIFEFTINKKALRKRKDAYPAKMVLAPILAYSPETNWGVGVGVKFLFKFPKSGPETRTSNLPMTVQYTLNNQFIINSGYTIFFNQEKFTLRGNIGYSQFPRWFYGIGNNTPESAKELYSYSMFLFEPLLLRRVVGKLFIGGGLRFSSVWDVGLSEKSQLPANPVSGYLGSRSVGLETAITYDTRDNVLNATRGMLVEFTYGRYGRSLGGTHVFDLTRFDIRQYVKLFRHRYDVLAFQLFGYFSSGDVPLTELAALGGKELMRGYYQGRYVSNNLIAGQVEYRMPLGERFGIVGFAGMGQVAGTWGEFSLNAFKPSFGLGLRFKIVKAENLNLRFDYGFGQGTSNYYFNVAEAF